ncbi:hypothetical protein [uncultured phage cr99_1]|uniref:Uncharacterized protein n=1 Tax=uncultured phage cr99_1 TaxID=2986399 RepID=A0AAE7V406_9CAUD|nr:hypothetical protein M1M49_gp17 [uncultured phage cr99_1]QWM89667.1 hypothetical protein [uncultured phage cr99_1]
MPRKNKTIHISDMPSEFKGTVTKDGRFIKSGIPPLGGVYDKVAKTTGLIRLGNEFLYNGINNLIPRNDREQLMDNTAGRLVDYVKNFNKESFPNDEDLGPTFPFNIIQTPRTNGRNIPQKQYATGGKVPNVVDGGIAHPLGNNFFYMNGRKHSQGGIDIGPSDKTGIEVEDGEIVETNGDELKVYSAQPIINGISPAKLVMGGANPNKVFKAQEDFKDRNKINDDGTIKAMGGLSRDKDYGSKKKPYPSVAKKDFAGGHRSYPIPTKADAIDALRLAGLHGRNDVKAKVYNKYPELRKKGSNGLIISISGNVKNGLLHSPSSTGGRHDKLRDGGKRINRHGRTWEYDEDNGYYIPITDRTITRTSPYPIDRSARGETVSGSEYTFRNGRWHKNKSNTFNDNPTKNSKVDNGNRRPQYYAERELPLFNDGPAITSGLVKAGWSHGNNKNITVDNTNIPNLPTTKSKGNTPRRGRNKSSQSVQSSSTKTSPTATYNRNLPTIEASIPTTLPVSTSVPVKQSSQSDGKGQGKFKNITAADWIGLGSNMSGSLASYFASKRAINKMRGPGQPTLISANKLKTKYNINPQLDRIREDKFEAYRDIDSNTASSRVSLARKQRVRNAAGQAANELYGNKENIETNLINQDRRNQQSVRQFNAQQYNQYIDRKAAFDNGIREAKVTNINNLFSGINAGIQDMISRYENRKALNNTIGAMRASAPNVDDRIMRDAGVDYDEFIIRKRRKLGGKQSCR